MKLGTNPGGPGGDDDGGGDADIDEDNENYEDDDDGCGDGGGGGGSCGGGGGDDDDDDEGDYHSDVVQSWLLLRITDDNRNFERPIPDNLSYLILLAIILFFLNVYCPITKTSYLILLPIVFIFQFNLWV